MVKVFHGTSFESFEKIVNDGEFRANIGTGVGSWTKDCIYFGTKFWVAGMHGYGAGASANWEEKGSVPYVVIEQYADEEVLLPDYDNNSECETWQKSSLKNGQICIKNSLKLHEDAIVYFVGGVEFELTLKTTLKEWKSFYERNKEKLQVPPVDWD